MDYAVIMAGGAGKRLWPMSRLNRPKQILPLVDGRSLMELAVERLGKIFAPENIFVITNAEYADIVAKSLPSLPRGNIVGEPIGRDTANVVALAAEIIAARDANGVMAVFTADHVITPEENFFSAVRLALDAAAENTRASFTFGIKPDTPHVGYGYMQKGPEVGKGLYKVVGFKEKPNAETAQKYFDGGDYYWNSGMFVWNVSAIRAELEKHLPDSRRKLEPVGAALAAGKDIAPMLAEIYPTLQKISIDYAVMEKAAEVIMAVMDCKWVDVGSWPSMDAVCKTDSTGNVLAAPNALAKDASRNVVVCEDGHLLAVMGVEDCIVVRTPDATLVCRKADAQKIKELLDDVESRFGKKYS